jgi:hypothetical protein
MPNSIQEDLLSWETCVNIAKASDVDNIQKYKSEIINKNEQ